jgi:hypothetical protein
LATMRPPALIKPIVKASVSAKTKKPTATSKKSQQMDDFVSGDQFDFQISESPVGPVTRYLMWMHPVHDCTMIYNLACGGRN